MILCVCPKFSLGKKCKCNLWIMPWLPITNIYISCICSGRTLNVKKWFLSILNGIISRYLSNVRLHELQTKKGGASGRVSYYIFEESRLHWHFIVWRYMCRYVDCWYGSTLCSLYTYNKTEWGAYDEHKKKEKTCPQVSPHC